MSVLSCSPMPTWWIQHRSNPPPPSKLCAEIPAGLSLRGSGIFQCNFVAERCIDFHYGEVVGQPALGGGGVCNDKHHLCKEFLCALEFVFWLFKCHTSPINQIP